MFISYRGKDLRLTLVPHIKHHLKDSNVNVFTDSNAAGEQLKELFNHIKNSRIVIVIFSISYLESRWCLDELAEIRNCLLRKQLDFVLPIFYKVKTSHVEKQSGDFGKPFPSLQKKHPRLRVLRWKKALKFVAKSIGLSYRENRYAYKFKSSMISKGIYLLFKLYFLQFYSRVGLHQEYCGSR